MKRFRRVSITIIICLIIILYWVFIALHSGQSIYKTQNSRLLLEYGAINGQLLGQGDYWRLIVSQFTHVNLYHLLANVVFIFFFGIYIEQCIGLFTLLFVYFFGGIVGQYASVVFNPNLVSSGASQALCSLAGFLLIHFYKVWRMAKIIGITVLLFILIQSYLDLHFAGHLKEGHLFGFITGMIIGLLYIINRKFRNHNRQTRSAATNEEI